MKSPPGSALISPPRNLEVVTPLSSGYGIIKGWSLPWVVIIKGQEFFPAPDMIGQADGHGRRPLPIALSIGQALRQLPQRRMRSQPVVLEQTHRHQRIPGPGSLAKACVLRVKAFNRSRNTPFSRSSCTRYGNVISSPSTGLPPPSPRRARGAAEAAPPMAAKAAMMRTRPASPAAMDRSALAFAIFPPPSLVVRTGAAAPRRPPAP